MFIKMTNSLQVKWDEYDATLPPVFLALTGVGLTKWAVSKQPFTLKTR